jgi:hypothetical protein
LISGGFPNGGDELCAGRVGNTGDPKKEQPSTLFFLTGSGKHFEKERDRFV